MDDKRMIAVTADGEHHELTIGDPLPPNTMRVYHNSDGSLITMTMEDEVAIDCGNGMTLRFPGHPVSLS